MILVTCNFTIFYTLTLRNIANYKTLFTLTTTSTTAGPSQGFPLTLNPDPSWCVDFYSGKGSSEVTGILKRSKFHVYECSNKSIFLTYGLGEKEARRPTPKWNTRFYLAFSIRA